MNRRYTLLFAAVAVVALAAFGVATLNMGNKEIGQQSPVAMENTPAPAVKNNATGVVSTGDPVQDIIGTVDAEGAGDATIMTDTNSDAALVANDSTDLSALTSTYDQAAF